MMRELIKLGWPDSMKSSHPKRSGHDDIKQNNSKKRARVPDSRKPRGCLYPCLPWNAKQMQTSQRCN